MNGEKLSKEIDSGPKILLRAVKKGKFFPNKMESFASGLKLILDDVLFSIEVIGNGFLFFIQDLNDLRKIVEIFGKISKSVHKKGSSNTDLVLWKIHIEKNATSLSDSQILDLIEKEFNSNGNPSFLIYKNKKALEISFPDDNFGYEKFGAYLKDFKKNLDEKSKD